MEPGAFRSKFAEKVTVGSGEWPEEYEGTITKQMVAMVGKLQGNGAPVSLTS